MAESRTFTLMKIGMRLYKAEPSFYETLTYIQQTEHIFSEYGRVALHRKLPLHMACWQKAEPLL